MAKTVIEVITDDLDGSEGASTVTFGLNGATWEIDLNEKNAAKLEKALEPFLAKARRAGGRTKAGKSSGPSAADIRGWAKENGFNVPDRGRIPAEVKDAYNAR